MAVEPGNLSFEKLEFTEQICCLGKHLLHKDLPAHLIPQLKASVDLLMHVSKCKNKLCHYKNCSKGNELCRHVFITCRKETGCDLCFSTLIIVKYHAEECTRSKCTLPYCREYKDYRKERQREEEKRRRSRARRNEKRIRRLRANEASLRRFYDSQMYESIRAAASAVLRLHAKGDESKRNDVKKMLGSLLCVINYCLSQKSRSKQKKGEEAKEEKRGGKEVY